MTFLYFSNLSGHSALRERLEGCVATISDICRVSGVVGMSVGVACEGQILLKFNYGYQDLADQITPTSSTVYAIGAITKSFTALAIARLVREGRLRYQMLVKDIMPDFRSSSNSVTEEATVMDVVTHRLCLARSDAWWCGSDGELLLNKQEIMNVIAGLPPACPFRSGIFYSSWNYALAGELIERVSGLPFCMHIAESVTLPLRMPRTTALHDIIPEADVADPYAVLDDGTWTILRRSQIQCGTIMGSALGMLSCVDDMLKYSHALIRALNDARPINHIFANLTIRMASSMLGLFFHQLPGPITNEGINGVFVARLPEVVPAAGSATCVVSQTGNLPGYTSFLSLLPELNASVVVLTNTIGLADPTSWVGHVLVAALVDCPEPVDIMSFVEEAVGNHIMSFRDIRQRFRRQQFFRQPTWYFTQLQDYVGTYRYDGPLDFIIVVRLIEGPNTNPKLQIQFQGRQSQSWGLEHLEGDTFHWLCSRNWHARRGRLTYPLVENIFKIVFVRNDNNKVRELMWAHDAEIDSAYSCFKKLFDTALELLEAS